MNSRNFRWTDHIARIEVGKSAFNILIGTPAGKIPLGRPRHRWDCNIRMNLKEIGINTRNCIELAQNRDYRRTLANAALNLRVQ
jgi:hypothetical protein